MSVIINRQIQENRWSHLSDDAPFEAGDVTVSLDRWVGEHECYASREGGIGIRLLPGHALDDVAPFLGRVEMVALEFDNFTEGRGYSHAYLLRERYGFTGEIRAIGARRDHVTYMERCGINAFEPAEQETVEQLLEGFDEITERYQPSHDRVPLIFRRRVSAAREQFQDLQQEIQS